MSTPLNPNQDQTIENSSIQESQVQLGQAEGDSIQIQGSGNQVVISRTFNQASNQDKTLSREEYRNRQILLNKVRNFWVKGVLEKSLYNKAKIELGLEERFDTLELLYDAPDQPRQALPDGTRAIDKFDELGEGRTLLILGNPGGGKTTAMLELVRDLVQRAELDVSLPIPIVFNLSSWVDRNQKITDWLVQELRSKYQISKKAAQTWLQDQQLLLLLDGLDEVEENLREACVQAINQFSQEHGQTEIVVCSRIKDYEVLSHRLRFQGAIFIQPLTSEQIVNYLDQAGAELAGVKVALQTNSVLQELAESPLMLNIMALTYQGISASKLTQLTKEEQQKQLFDQYIQKMFNRRVGKQLYSKDQANRWLIWLARRMTQDSQTIFLIEQMQPVCLETKIQRCRYRVGIGVLSGFIWAAPAPFMQFVLAYLLDILFQSFTSPTLTQLLINMLGVVSSVPIYGLVLYLVTVIRSKGMIRPVETLRWSWKRAWEGLIIWSRNIFLAGLVLGLTFGLIVFFYRLWTPFSELKEIYKELTWLNWLHNLPNVFIVKLLYLTLLSLSFVIIFGGIFSLPFVLTWGPIGALLRGLETSIVGKSVSPNQGIRRSAINAVIISFIGGLGIGLIFGLIVTSFGISRSGILEGLKFGLFFAVIGIFGGPLFGIISGMACIQHLALRITLHKEGFIPWNYARFLDWTCERLLLQKVGGGYIFVHRLLLEHFAQMDTTVGKSLQSD